MAKRMRNHGDQDALSTLPAVALVEVGVWEVMAQDISDGLPLRDPESQADLDSVMGAVALMHGLEPDTVAANREIVIGAMVAARNIVQRLS